MWLTASVPAAKEDADSDYGRAISSRAGAACEELASHVSLAKVQAAWAGTGGCLGKQLASLSAKLASMCAGMCSRDEVGHVTIQGARLESVPWAIPRMRA